MIISRYITKEILLTYIAIISGLVFIAISNQFVSILSKSAAGKMPVSMVFEVILLYIPEYMALLSPLAIFIAIIFAHGRLHADSEIPVLLASGYNWSKLTAVTLKLAMIIASFVLLLTIWLLPNVTEYREQLLAEGEAVGILHAITPGRFQELNEGRTVFYVENYDEDSGEMSNVFIAEQADAKIAKPGLILTAKSANLHTKDVYGNFLMLLKNGHRYVGNPGELNYSVVSFDSYGRTLVADPEPVPSHLRPQATSEIIGSSNLEHQAELQWRIALPLSVIILSLLAIPLAKVEPRQGRFAKFLPGIMFYIIYFNLMIILKRQVTIGNIPSIASFWSVHVLFIVLGLFFIMLVSGRVRQLLKSINNRTMIRDEYFR